VTALPARIESGRVGIVDIEGESRRIRLALVTAAETPIATDDWLLIQRDLAVASLNAVEATGLGSSDSGCPSPHSGHRDTRSTWPERVRLRPGCGGGHSL
jgi:hypothetical protein